MVSQINEQLLDEKLEQLEKARAWSPRVISKLETLIRSADDYALFRINPYQYAAEKNMTVNEVIDLFLYSAKFGLLEMEWHLICHTCGHVVESFRELSNLHTHFVCINCTTESDVALDDFVKDELLPPSGMSTGAFWIAVERLVAEFGPAIAGLHHPGRPHQRGERHAGQATGHDGVGRHSGGIRMRGVDHRVDLVRPQEVGEPLCTAETADTGGDRLRPGRRGAPGQRQRRLEAHVAGDALGQSRGFRGAAEDENTHCRIGR